MEIERDQTKEKNKKYTYEDMIRDAKAGNLDKVRAMGFGDAIKTILGKDDTQIGEPIKDGKEEDKSFLGKMKDFFHELGDKSPFSSGQQKGLLLAGKMLDIVNTTKSDQEIEFGDEKSIMFSKEGNNVNAFDQNGEELSFGKFLDTASKGIENLEQNKVNGIDELIQGFKGKEQEVNLADNAINGMIGIFSKMLALNGQDNSIH